MKTILDLPRKYKEFSKEDKEAFDRIYSFKERTGELILTNEMKPMVKKQFGSISKVEKQKILRVDNKWMFQGTLFNSIRANRPISTKHSVTKNDLKKMYEKEFFSKPLINTPEDVFGRIKSKHCVTCSNFAKYDAVHGLTIFKEPNPLKISKEAFKDHVETSLKWFEKAINYKQEFVFPIIGWNSLWKAGASLVHGHFQLLLGEDAYGYAKKLNHTRLEYAKLEVRNYFDDLYDIHKKLGLGKEVAKIKYFSCINPRRGKDIMIIGKELNGSFINLLYKIINTLITKSGMDSFNMNIVLPPLNYLKEWEGFPVIAHVLSRGSLSNNTSDIGVMEILNDQYVVSDDPCKIWELIK